MDNDTLATEEEFYNFLSRQKKNLPKASKILFVDDDPDQLLLFATLLRNDGFTVAEATNGEEALSYLSSAKVDLVITDAMMPKIDGEELTKQLRATSLHTNIPIIILTAAKNNLAESIASERGPDMFCMKKDAAKILIGQVNFLLN